VSGVTAPEGFRKRVPDSKHGFQVTTSNRNASEESAALQPEQFLSEAGESDLAQELRCLANTPIQR
jgi:hypothetical protein